jgi:phosphatidylglycerophosphatase A
VSNRRAGPAIWIATAGGAGYFPIAPGTAGSAVGILIVFALARLPLQRIESIAVLAAVAAVLFAIGVWAATKAESFFGKTDPGQVVIDEVVGQMLTLVLFPRGNWEWLLGGFILFRLFDIVKPFPARQAERFSRGWGIMVDDVVAGLYGLAVLVVIGLIKR